MGNIRAWASLVAQDYKTKKVTGIRVSELLEHLQSELSCEEPDYMGCADALMAFHYQYIGNFYKDLYGTLSKNAQFLLNASISSSIKANPKTRTMKMALVIAWRLKQVRTGNEIAPELQCYISNYVEKYMGSDIQNICDNCSEAALQKLLLADIQDWEISMSRVKIFYQTLFEGSTDVKTQEMYQKFLADNYLNDSIQNKSSAQASEKTKSEDTKDLSTPSTSTLASKDIPVSEKSDTASAKDIPNDLISETSPLEKPTAKKETSALLTSSVSSPLASQADRLRTSIPPSSDVPQQSSSEPELEKDGVKLAELLLAWSKKQASGTAALKESLRVSEREHKRLNDQFSNLREELFSVKKELGDRDAKISSLQRQLAEVTAHLDSSQKQAADFDETIRKLQRMNENSASQAVLGYKSELATALKSIVEDASLPEAQRDADILSALLGDLLDTLRFKGIPLEGK